MLVADMSPTRLARAKAAIAGFVRRKGTGNVGLIAFAGAAFLQCPLTRDYDAFYRTLEETDTTSIQVAGTDIGRAIEEAEPRLLFEPQPQAAHPAHRRRGPRVRRRRDGEEAQAQGPRGPRRGRGHAFGGQIRVVGETGSIETLRNAEGEEVLSRLDEKTLGEVAEATGGRFVRLGQAGEGMEALRLAIQSGTDERGAGRQGVPREEWFLGLALLILVAESLLSTRRPSKP
jgi:Ca-activated chloride channel family protein